VLAWTGDGIWVTVPNLGIALVDPVTGGSRVVVRRAAGEPVAVVGLATSIAAGVRVVPATAPARPVSRVEPDEHGFGLLDKLRYLLVWLPMYVLGLAGYAVVVGVLAAVATTAAQRSLRARGIRRQAAEGARPQRPTAGGPP
jgi:hypothetical protein